MAIWGAVIGAAITAGATAAIAAASKPKLPKQQGIGEISAGATYAEATTLPARRAMEQAARLGDKSTYKTGNQVYEKTIRRAKWKDAAGKWNFVPWFADEWQPGGKYANLGITPKIEFYPSLHGKYEEHGRYLPETRTVDFTGLGDVDLERAMSERMVPGLLELQKEYDPQFQAEAKRLQELADPEGTLARKMLAERITAQAEQSDTNAMANTLESQMKSELALGGSVAPETQRLLQQLMGEKISEQISPEELAAMLEEGSRGTGRSRGRESTALGWMGSGATPEDIRYRRSQQNLSNMGSFLAGQTPQSQWAQISGAQQGAMPFATGAGLPMQNLSAAQQAAGLQGNVYGQQMAYQSKQVDPWFAGLSTAIQGAGALGQIYKQR